ncbi:hypothetical protein [uncultured Oscillibacter sp.]|uniref:hypothetical protein n=1 Tax=uncultured Oscillibacter sp. TaxID=876091 RepID=UPI0025FDF2F6|nr:hypothetical protein [uncultured Oscillibacter sp.]
MKKSNLWCGAAYALLGLVFLLAGLLWETRLSSLCVGFGAGMLSSGVVQLARYRKWTRPQNAAVYRQRLEEEQIDLRDERKEMLRDKSGRYAWLLGMALCAAAVVVFGVLGALEIVENSRLIVLCLAAYLIVQYGAGVLFYRRLSKKY